jgi:hypothetical protein
VLRDDAIAMILQRHHKVTGASARGLKPFLLLWLGKIGNDLWKEIVFVSSPARLSHISRDGSTDFILPACVRQRQRDRGHEMERPDEGEEIDSPFLSAKSMAPCLVWKCN